jgi:hypothetical protein
MAGNGHTGVSRFPSERIGTGWMLISAGDGAAGKSGWNTMTASWGVLWGRNIDKAAGAGLTPIAFGSSYERAAGAIGFKEAQEIIVCRKLYTHDFDPAQFLYGPSIEANYQGKDCHRMFIGEILVLLVKK